jgi:group I intron endonuclease
MAAGIYKIQNRVDGKFYIGSAVDLAARERQHRRHLRNGVHKNRLLQAAWTKDGEAAFQFRTLLVCARDDLLMFEQRAIDGYGAAIDGYNLHPIAGSFLGYKRGPFTAEHRAKLRAARQGRVFPPRTPEQLERQSQAIKASWARGQRKPPAPPTPERGARISAALTPAHIENMAAAKRGKTLSPEHRQKISESHAGRWTEAERARHADVVRAIWARRKAEAAPCP